MGVRNCVQGGGCVHCTLYKVGIMYTVQGGDCVQGGDDYLKQIEKSIMDEVRRKISRNLEV